MMVKALRGVTLSHGNTLRQHQAWRNAPLLQDIVLGLNVRHYEPHTSYELERKDPRVHKSI